MAAGGSRPPARPPPRAVRCASCATQGGEAPARQRRPNEQPAGTERAVGSLRTPAQRESTTPPLQPMAAVGSRPPARPPPRRAVRRAGCATRGDEAPGRLRRQNAQPPGTEPAGGPLRAPAQRESTTPPLQPMAAVGSRPPARPPPRAVGVASCATRGDEAPGRLRRRNAQPPGTEPVGGPLRAPAQRESTTPPLKPMAAGCSRPPARPSPRAVGVTSCATREDEAPGRLRRRNAQPPGTESAGGHLRTPSQLEPTAPPL